MKYPFTFLLFSAIITVTGCGSKKEAGSDEEAVKDEPAWGTYYFGSGDKTRVVLKEDSTAILDISMGTTKVHNEGRFLIRNDSIFISWQDGQHVKSRFESKEGVWQFRIGSTTYKKRK